MKNITVALPFTEEELDKYFDDIKKYFFYIDLEKSKLRGRKLLNYIYNSGMKCELELSTYSDALHEIIHEYIKENKLVSIRVLNDIWSDMIIYDIDNSVFGLNKNYQMFIKKLTQENREELTELENVYFNLFSRLYKIVAKQDPDSSNKDKKTISHIEMNFLSLRNTGTFWKAMNSIHKLKLEEADYTDFYECKYDGKKMGHYFLNEFSPFSFAELCLENEKKEMELNGEKDNSKKV